MVSSRLRFAENGKEMYRNKKKHVNGVQSFCFCSLKYAKCVSSVPSRPIDLKLPYDVKEAQHKAELACIEHGKK